MVKKKQKKKLWLVLNARYFVLHKSADLWLSSILILGQVDPWDGAKRPEKLLQVCLTGVLRKVGHTDGGIVISCQSEIHTTTTTNKLGSWICLHIQWMCMNPSKTETHTPTSAVGLHGFSSPCAAISQAWWHIFPGFALGGLGWLGFRWIRKVVHKLMPKVLADWFITWNCEIKST